MLTKPYRLAKKGLPLFFIISLLTSIILVQQSSPVVVYDKAPSATAVWVISPVYNNTIGNIIVATLRLTHAKGTMIDYERMPDVGDVWDLRDKRSAPTATPEEITPIYPSPNSDFHGEQNTQSVIEEGQVEVRSRSIKNYHHGENIVTEIRLELQYLDPIDFSGLDDKRLSSYVTVFQVYWHYDDVEGLGWYRSTFEFDDGVFYVTQRVNQNSLPMLKLHHPKAPKPVWSYLRLAGFGILVMSLLLLVRQGLGIADNLTKKSKSSQTSPIIETKTSLNELHSLWLTSFDYHHFIQAVILFRERNLKSCSDKLWNETTYILYSGDVLSEVDVKILFAEMMKEDQHDTAV